MIIFNREKERKELTKIIKDNEFIFIDGISGVGKSSLIQSILEQNFNDPIIFPFKERDTDEEFFKLIDIIYEILHEEYTIKDIKAINKQFGTVELEKIYKNNETIKKLKDSILSTNYRILTNKDYATFFGNFWKVLEKKDIKVIWLSNIEFVKDTELEFLKAFIFSKENNIKIIFEKGTLVDSNTDIKLKNLIINKKSINYTIEPFDKDHTRGFCKYLGKEYSDEIFLFSNGIPIAIEYEQALRKIVDYDYTSEEKKFLSLLVIMFEFIDDYGYIRYLMDKLDIGDIDLNNDKFEFIIEDEQAIRLNHYYIYKLLRKKLSTELLKNIKKLDFMKKKRKKIYYAILARFYPIKLLEDEIDEFILFLIDEIEKFNILELKKYLSFKIDIDDNDIKTELLKLIQIQVNTYFFDKKKIDFLDFYNDSLKLIGFILRLQYLSRQNKFEDIIFLIKNEFKQYFINSSNDTEFLDYIKLTISALKSTVFISMGNYTEARDLLQDTIENAKNKNTNKTLNDYILNILPAVEFTNSLQYQDFTSFQNIKNLYIKFKRHHNILALKLYDYENIQKNKNIFEDEVNELIQDFMNISSVEKSYTINNLFAFYIITNNLEKAKDIIFDIEYKYFENYDRISLYNNAIIYFILTKNGSVKNSVSI